MRRPSPLVRRPVAFDEGLITGAGEKTYLENSDPSVALRNHGDAIILPGLAVETLRRVQSAVLGDRDIGHILLIDDKKPGAVAGRAGAAVLRKHLPDVRARHVLLRVEDERSGGRSPAINGHRVLDKQTEHPGSR